MNTLTFSLIALAGVGCAIWITNIGLEPLGSLIVSDDELRASAAFVQLNGTVYKGNVESFLVDNPGGDILPEARSYARRFPGSTWIEADMHKGMKRAIWMKLTGQKIEMPELKIKDGYHITRQGGSAALVKDHTSEPTFGCIEGYRSTADGCAPSHR